MTEEIQIINEIEKAAYLCEKIYTHEEIINILKTENDFEKQICLLKLEKLLSYDEAELLVYQLTGHHGLIREAAALKINEFITADRYILYFLTDYSQNYLLKAVNDINPNICRLICAALKPLFQNNDKEKKEFLNILYNRFHQIFEELETLKRSNRYTKKLFNLYWCLEALAMLNPEIDSRLESVLSTTSNIREYTIREKTAMVLASLKTSSIELDKIKNKLKNDENFYVKRYSKAF